MEELKTKIKDVIIRTLKLEEVSPEEIGSDEPLFDSAGLGLDSIDALELGVALRKEFNLKIDEDSSEEIKKHFYSVSTLANFIASRGGL